MDQQLVLKRTYQVNALIGAAMVISVFIYIVIIEVVKYYKIELGFFYPDIFEKISVGFVLASIAIYFLINFIRKLILRKKPGDNIPNLIVKLSFANIVSMALCELPALFGLILFWGTGIYRDCYILMIISLVLFYKFFPRYSFWEEWTKTGIISM
jgi:hypothetical protein